VERGLLSHVGPTATPFPAWMDHFHILRCIHTASPASACYPIVAYTYVHVRYWFALHGFFLSIHLHCVLFRALQRASLGFHVTSRRLYAMRMMVTVTVTVVRFAVFDAYA
jgi:hypothetical protein